MMQTPSSLPIGGSTGLDHETTAAVDEAARWLASQNPRPQPAVPALRARFGLTALEACWALRDAGRLQQGKAAQE